MIKRLIFDVDGTLITDVNFIPCIEATLKKLGFYSEENVRLFLEAISSYEKAFNSYNNADYISYFGNALGVKLDDCFLNIFFDELKTCVPLENKKIKATIRMLAQNYELVLLTNYFKESQLNRLCTMGIGNLFSECYGEELIKPNDEVYLQACGNHKPNECIMIGDDPYLDIEKAQKLGMNTILVNSKELSFDNFHTIVVNKVEEISIDLIESIIESKKDC